MCLFIKKQANKNHHGQPCFVFLWGAVSGHKQFCNSSLQWQYFKGTPFLFLKLLTFSAGYSCFLENYHCQNKLKESIITLQIQARSYFVVSFLLPYCFMCLETREAGTVAAGVETSRDVICSADFQLPSVTAGWLWTCHRNPIKPQFPSLKKNVVLLTTLFWKWIQIVLGSYVWSSGT